MLIGEARWLATQIGQIESGRLFPMLNVGSQTEEFRMVDQPWIDEFIFGPLKERGLQVKHLDLQAGQGVDIVGDLSDSKFLAEIKKMSFSSVFCSNLFEHVVNREEIARLLTEVVPSGGFIILSVPYKFPYHPDPIDTMFRPSPEELATLFPNTTIWKKDVVRGGNLTTYVLQKFARHPTRTIRRLFAQRKARKSSVDTQDGGQLRSLVPWLIRTFEVTCLILQKQ